METALRPVQLPIASLREGMMIDLETLEAWLDLDDCPTCEVIRHVWEFEFAVVEGGEWETRDCYRLDTDQGSFGLPGDILVGVIYEDER